MVMVFTLLSRNLTIKHIFAISARKANANASIKKRWILLVPDDLVVLRVDVPMFCQGRYLEKNGKGNKEPGRNGGVSVVGNERVDILFGRKCKAPDPLEPVSVCPPALRGSRLKWARWQRTSDEAVVDRGGSKGPSVLFS